MDIKTIIEAKIKDVGLTKREVAERMGIIPNNINAMLVNPSWPTLERLSKALGMSVSQLVSDETGSSEPIVDGSQPVADGEVVITKGGNKFRVSINVEPIEDKT